MATEIVQKSRDGDVRFGNRQNESARFRPHRLNRRQLAAFLGERLGQVLRAEFDHMLAAKLGDQFPRRAESNDLPLIDDGDAIAQSFRFIHVVRGDDDGAALVLEAADYVPKLPSRLRVEAGGRFVEEQQVGIADECRGDGEPLLLPAGELFHRGVRLFAQ